MSIQAPAWFVPQYNSRVINIYQAKGNRLRSTVTQAQRIEGEKAIWWIAGEGRANKKQRATRAVPMNPDRKKVEENLQTWEAFDTVEEYDLDRMNVNEREVVYQAGAMALGRATDQEIVDKINEKAATAGNNFIDNSANPFSMPVALQACQRAQRATKSWDGRWFCPLPSLAFNQLLTWKQVSSSDYVGDDLPFKKMTDTRFWNGVNWFLMPEEFFPVPGAGLFDTFLWHQESLGWANNEQLRTIPQWDNYMSWWTINMQAKGAAIVWKPEGIIRIRVNDTSAITGN